MYSYSFSVYSQIDIKIAVSLKIEEAYIDIQKHFQKEKSAFL